MRRPDEIAPALDLFGETPAPPTQEREDAEPGLWPVVAIAGVWIDFTQPSAPRVAAAAIFALDQSARAEAVDLVPPNFRDFVMDLVERADYNAGRAG